ncbi:MAG: hypothetical protein KBD39_02860 [Sterolibacterium sp.]|jgi:hypothetical protein|nr:hypothetical protein [Sterolibacterium sp.]MBP9799039.1 hypothetical protein [Sterolibacterium sp.]
MNHIRSIIGATWLILLSFMPLTGHTGEVAVLVVTSRNATVSQQLSQQQIADLFLGQSYGASRLKPIDSSDEVLRERFYQEVAGMSANRARAIWARLVFSTRQVPPREMSPEAAAQQLLGSEDIITYLYRDHLPKGAKVLLTLP